MFKLVPPPTLLASFAMHAADDAGLLDFVHELVKTIEFEPRCQEGNRAKWHLGTAFAAF